MKNIIIITILLTGLLSQAFAQQGRNRPDPEKRLEMITQRIESQMDLDDEKLEKVGKVFEQHIAAMEKEREKMQSVMLEKRAQLIKERNEDLKEILSEEEYDLMIALMESSMRQPRGGGGKGPGGKGRGN